MMSRNSSGIDINRNFMEWGTQMAKERCGKVFKCNTGSKEEKKSLAIPPNWLTLKSLIPHVTDKSTKQQIVM